MASQGLDFLVNLRLEMDLPKRNRTCDGTVMRKADAGIAESYFKMLCLAYKKSLLIMDRQTIILRVFLPVARMR